MDHDRDHNRPVDEAVFRHLYEAIERMRRDIAEVEFWAAAVARFAEPIPEYKPSDMRVWFPPEQATILKRRSDRTR